MSRWTEAFKGHAFHKQLEDAQRYLVETTYPANAPTQGHDELARLRKLLAFVDASVKGIDPDLANPTLLGNLQGPIQGVQNELVNFYGNSNIGHLQTANSHADNMISIIASQACIPFGAEGAAVQESASAYQAWLDKSVADVRLELETLLRNAKEDFAEFKRAEKGVSERIDRMEKRLTDMDSQMSAQLNGYSTSFQASENARGERFEKWMQGYDGKLDDAFVAYTKKAGVATQAIDQLQLQAGKVLGSVVDTSQAGAYATYATEEKKSANQYRRFAILLMALAAIVLFVPEIIQAVHSDLPYSVDWKKALPRLPFSLVLFAPALYLAKESSRHRTNEITNRRRQHILTTIGPYLALLPEAKAEEIKAEVAKSIFSEGGPAAEDKTSDTSNLLAQLANLAAKLKP